MFEFLKEVNAKLEETRNLSKSVCQHSAAIDSIISKCNMQTSRWRAMPEAYAPLSLFVLNPSHLYESHFSRFQPLGDS